VAYCSQTDIEYVITAEVVTELADDDGDGVADTAVVDWAIGRADNLIDSKLKARYNVPFSTVPALIKDLSAELAAYYLGERRQRISESMQNRYDGAIKLLNRIAEGRLLLLGVTPTTEGPEVSKTVDADRKFTLGRDDSGTTGTLDNY
jgi:phage gp36-like protein